MMYYILQGFLFYTMLYVITEFINSNNIEKEKVYQYLKQHNISFSYYLFINLFSICKRVVVEELLLRWIVYYKLSSSIFSNPIFSTGLYLLIGYLFVINKLKSYVDTLIWIIQLIVHLYIYKQSGTIWCPIIVGIYSDILRLI